MRMLIDEFIEITAPKLKKFIRVNNIQYAKSLQEKYANNYYKLLDEFDVIITNVSDLIELRDHNKSSVIIIKLDTELREAHLRTIMDGINLLEKGKTYSLKSLSKPKKKLKK